MKLSHQIAQLKNRLKHAREFYGNKTHWGKNLAWKILVEIAQTTPGNYRRVEREIAIAVEAQDMRWAFTLLGEAAKQAISDLETAQKENYDIDYMDMFGEQ